MKLLCIEDRVWNFAKGDYYPTLSLKYIKKGEYCTIIKREFFNKKQFGFGMGLHYLVQTKHGKTWAYHSRFKPIELNKQIIVL